MTRPHNGPIGKELAARRKAAGLTQAELAQRAGVGRSAVQYWERAPRLDARGWAVRRMADALGWTVPAWKETSIARAGEKGDSRDWRAEVEEATAQAFAAWQAREAQRAKTVRVTCGAKTRKNTNCRNKSEPGRKRCKFHGGKSTGARTPEGIERIREAQRRRWARWPRAEFNQPKSSDMSR
ncbi:helix-turn-helix domain-containing protein [Paracoccus aminophilus]|uniref:helix-turn-helix domain-containing protein n=1 Tax=Paracoccus aminophilus TaxID=34003 RepID=UPI00059F05D2|nr:helix-turn-helix transcriptional regulator [Paracoccus aminophilus]